VTPLDIPLNKEFLETFNAEAKERLQALTEGLLSLEQSGADEECVKSLFRQAHTLKGSAGMMGFETIKSLAHRIEDMLSGVQKGQMELDQEKTDVILEAVDRIGKLLPSVDGTSGTEEDVSELLERMGECAPEAAAEAGEAEGSGTGAGDGAEEDREPSPATRQEKEQGEQEGPPMGNRYAAGVDDAGRGEARPVEEGGSPPQGSDREEGAGKRASQGDQTIRVRIERLDKLLNLMGEILVSQAGTEGNVVKLAHLQARHREFTDLFRSISRQVEELMATTGGEEAEELSSKVNKAGAVAAEISQQLESATAALKENTASHRLSLDELHDSTLNVRMLPLATIFGIYPRVVRDAARACGKKVRLKVSGEKTELDKRVLEQITDPLLHIVRNCVDHGIESPERRAAAGKPEQGTVNLSAEQRGDRVDIIIEDDGAGIDTGRIKATAARKGIVAEPDDLSDQQAMELIFRPGFSTAEKVTEISGRGVGMDVVRNNIRELDGTVSVYSEPGRGTRFVVSLPMTLVVINGLLVESGDSSFIVPVSSVKEMVSITADQVQTLGGARGFIMRDSVVSLVDMLELLGGGPSPDEGDKAHVIVVDSGTNILGLQVERLIGEQEVVVKPLSRFFGRHPFISGVSILAGGDIAVVLNAMEMAGAVEAATGAVAGVDTEGAAPGKERRLSVMVVEDSLVVRELQRNILEAAGYRVQTAVDGRDALSKLDEHPVDCIVTDIEMPGMDGFDLTSEVRGREQTQDTPVIIVTSLKSEEDKRRGIEVGADAYVVKGSFDQKELLETIDRLVA